MERETQAKRILFYRSALDCLGKLALGEKAFDELLEDALDLVGKVMEVEALEVLAFEPETETFSFVGGRGWKGCRRGVPRFGAEERHLETAALRSQKPWVCEDYLESVEFLPAPHTAEHGFRAALCVPVPGPEGPFGVLCAFRRGADSFQEEEGRFLEVVADILGDALRMQATQKRLKEEEERLQLVLNGADMGTWSWDLEANRVFPDDRFLRFFGEDAFRERVKDFEDLVERTHKEDRKALEEELEAHMAGEKALFDWEGRFLSADRGWRWLHIRGRVVERSPRGEPLRMAGVAQDVTEKKQLETQLFQAQKLESVGRLAAGIAHEINTPTQYVSDNTMFLKESGADLLRFIQEVKKAVLEEGAQTVPDEVKGRIERLIEELDLDFLLDEFPKAVEQSLEGLGRVAKIVRAMKEFSHPGSLVQEPVDLNKAIRSTVTIARNEWKYVSDLVTDLDPDLPLVKCYAGDFNQVILNLIVNAAHAIEDVVREKAGAKGKITVTTRKKGDWVEIRVQDTGSGIPEEIRAKIFEPFFTTKPVGKGTGQGLSLVYSVIKGKHGGEIELESRVGRGSTFILRIPIGGKREEGSEASNEEGVREGGRSAGGAGRLGVGA